jgi:crossover junction endodeoxyribonuclease RuvC
MAIKSAPAPSALILGVDPGGSHTGYGLVLSQGEELRLAAQGRFSPKSAWAMPRRLVYIHQGLSELTSAHRPAAVAVEDIFQGRNIRSAIKLGHVRGVVLLAAAQAGAEVFSYAPRLVKNAVAGYGQADKAQVAHMVGELLRLTAPLAPDAADALAVAICHASQCRLARLCPEAAPAAARRGRSSWRSLSLDDLAALGGRPGDKG